MNTETNSTEQVINGTAKKENKVLNVIVNIILVLVILFAAFCGYSAFVTKAGSGVPSIFGFRVFAIQSDSMVPTFSKGDLVIDTAVSNDTKLNVDDIITFWTVIEGQRALNTHRIVQVNDYKDFTSYITKGDNNSIEDSMTVDRSSVVGKYKFSIPKLGSFIDFLQTSKGFFICIVIPVALFFIYYLVQFFRALFAYQAEKTRLNLEAMYAAQHPGVQIKPEAAPVEKVADSPLDGEIKAELQKEDKTELPSAEVEAPQEDTESTVIEEKTEEVIEEKIEENSAEKPKKKKKVIKKVIVYEEVEDDDESEGTEDASTEMKEASTETQDVSVESENKAAESKE